MPKPAGYDIRVRGEPNNEVQRLDKYKYFWRIKGRIVLVNPECDPVMAIRGALQLPVSAIQSEPTICVESTLIPFPLPQEIVILGVCP